MASEPALPAERVTLHAGIMGAGPPLLILHGLYGNGGNWRRHARWLAAQRQVLLVDLRNHGRSPHHPRMDYPAMAADISALMDGHGIGAATVLGHSMGGKVAMLLALTAPQRVDRLIVADIAPIAYAGDNAAILDAMQRVDLAAIRSRRDADPLLADAVDEPAIRQFLLTNLEHGAAGWRWRLPLETLRAAVDELEGWPQPPGEYTGPALFVHGARSGYATGEAATAAIHRTFPQARIEAIADAGHFLHVEQPEAFAAVLEDFLEQSSAP